MMKRLFIVAAAVALVSSSAMAASLLAIAPIGTNTASTGNAITADGKFVVGDSGAGGYWWQVGVGAPAVFNTPVWGNFSVAHGVGYRNVSGSQQLVAHGLSNGWSASVYSTDNGATWNQGVRAISVGTAPAIPAANSLGDNRVDDAYFTVFQGDTGSSPTIYVEKDAGQPPALVSRDAYGTTQQSSVQGVSGTGKSVGRRRDDAGNYYRNTRWQYNGTGWATQSYFTGLDGTNKGEAWAVSADGTKIFGMSPVTGTRTGNWPYMRDEVANTIVELPTFANTAGSVTNGLVYGASADGRWAVGMDYRGVEKAVLWNIASGNIIDLTDYAIAQGILLDGFWRLSRAYSVGVNALGQPVITGRGVWFDVGSTVGYARGYVMTMDVPEPATVGFLALASLFVGRRKE